MSSKFTEFLKNIKPSYKKKHLSVNETDVYSHKGSGYKGKGNVNTDTKTFNKPRKA
jgi:hypothetical protein